MEKQCTLNPSKKSVALAAHSKLVNMSRGSDGAADGADGDSDHDIWKYIGPKWPISKHNKNDIIVNFKHDFHTRLGS